MVWTKVSECVSCRHSHHAGQIGYETGEVRMLLMCRLHQRWAEERCSKYEYEPGTDVDGVRLR